MEINDILNTLGLDLSNPEARRGAIEAIDAILSSRAPISGEDVGGNSVLGGVETEVELDPDLIQPSVKQAPSSDVTDDIEVEDEENILDQIKHKESEDPIDNSSSSESSSSNADDESESGQEDENTADSVSADTSKDSSASKEDTNSKTDNKSKDQIEDDELNDSTEDEEENEDEDEQTNVEQDEQQSDGQSSDPDSSVEQKSDDFGDDSENNDNVDDEDEDEEYDEAEEDEEDEDDDYQDSFDDVDVNVDDDSFDSYNDDQDDEHDDEDDADDFEFDEDDIIDDELKDSTEDEEEKTKHGARKLKRERTLSAAKNALSVAISKKVSPSLIRELEKSIEALEALTEAVTKSINDISDDEFNILINRVLDAIDACGDSGLTFKSDAEREAQVKEIKADLAKAETQNELSAEDIAQIRKETQAVKSREKETSKYQTRAAGSFKGFQEFLNSLYKAIALQVDNEESRDDSWSAINRRYSGTGILQPGKKINDLPNRRIPIIDFYFDCSISWDQNDIEVGKKAVAALADLEQKGQIKVNIYYFSNDVSQNYNDVAGESTRAWNYIIKNIIATQANNVVIMTDGDMEGQGKGAAGASGHLRYTVPGYVWYLWKDGENAPRLPRDLQGRGGVQQFSFSASDV